MMLFLILWNGIGLGCAGLMAYAGIQSIQTQDFFIHPSDPFNWSVEDPTIQLQARLYLPAGFTTTQHYPTVTMFHGVGRNLTDNEYMASQLAGYGIVCLLISFRGFGLSNGTFPSDNGALYNVSFGDALGCYRYLHNQSFVDQSRLMAFGISLGGGAAIFLAVNNLMPKFVAWYPATGDDWGTQPLYTYNLTSPDEKGLIYAGTADTCGVCLPPFTQTFSDDNNNSVELRWLQGAVHTDSRFYMTTLTGSIQWILNEWGIQPNWAFNLYVTGYWGLIIACAIVGWDLVLEIRAIIKRIQIRRQKKRSLN
jgi:dienelactone hydrolase